MEGSGSGTGSAGDGNNDEAQNTEEAAQGPVQMTKNGVKGSHDLTVPDDYTARAAHGGNTGRKGNKDVATKLTLQHAALKKKAGIAKSMSTEQMR